MPFLPHEGPAVSLGTAGLILAALPQLAALGLPHPTATAVVDAAGVSRSRAYELRAAIEAVLPSVLKPSGRPPKPAAEADLAVLYRIAGQARDFAYAHPGAVCTGETRRRYSDDFRRFVLDSAAEHRDVPLDRFTEAIGVPLPTLQDWLAGGREATRPVENLTTTPPRDPTGPQIETVLAVWKTWKGGFSAFCRHVQHDWRLPFGRTLLADLLTAYGVRFSKRRSGRSPDEDALRKQFETWYPNAQLVGDGMALDVVVGGDVFTVNVELLVDPCSGAVTGASVRDTEDAAAVIEAFRDSVATTGEAPLAVLLDNKPSNHAEAVTDALGETKIVRATPFRPQNKAHVEGVFGLFQQTVPAIVLSLTSPKEVAKQLAALVVATWARALNHRPRPDRNRKSRVELHLGHQPTTDEVDRARRALDERIRRQQAAKATLAARQDPLVRATVTAALARLGFEDPNGTFLTGLARYPIDAVTEGIAIVEGKRRAGTLPPDVDARYLLGCVRNVAEEREGVEIALALWDERVRAGDLALGAAERERGRLDEDVDEVAPRITSYVDRALRSSRRLDRYFWLTAVADAVLDQDDAERHPLFRLAARRIHATHAVPHPDRLAATRFLAAKLLPIAG